jgi:hypothetical protein
MERMRKGRRARGRGEAERRAVMRRMGNPRRRSSHEGKGTRTMSEKHVVCEEPEERSAGAQRFATSSYSPYKMRAFHGTKAAGSYACVAEHGVVEFKR